ncbi:uncharacterized protein LOC101735983 isoform X1 [Bombyx mori]|uniref:uncharacterized protein LOC101735983 isoform X1 n=1 Tax=Bombyx mori TaxID=7091 RepID=UPI002ED4FB4B
MKNMPLPTRNNKENFRLLDLSSEDESEDLQLEIIPSRKKKATRRERNRVTTPPTTKSSISTDIQCALQWAVCGTLLLWLVMLTRLYAQMYDQVSTMNGDIVKVSTSSASVTDALQICHTAAKELRGNTSVLSHKLAELEEQHQILVSRVDAATQDLATLSKKLDGAPTLADTPMRLAELQRTVAVFGSEIKSLDGSLQSAKNQALTATTGIEEVRNLLRQLDARTNETISNVTANQKANHELKDDVTSLNKTIVAKVEALQTRIDEIQVSVVQVFDMSLNLYCLPYAAIARKQPPIKVDELLTIIISPIKLNGAYISVFI